MRYNPFNDSGITNYEQFKLYPFLVFGTLETIKNRISQQISQIKDGYHFGERLILLGERGIGKTSALFFIKDMLGDADINVYYFTRLFEDVGTIHARIEEYIKREKGENIAKIVSKDKINNLFKEPCYILIDFPDSMDLSIFKKFLIYLWDLMTHPNYNMINFIFSMNKSHYDKSFAYSEIFGKFLTISLDRFNNNETENLIKSRLKIIDLEIDEVFSKETIEIITNFSKGIPRNVISACNLLITNSNGKLITKDTAESILKEKYFEQLLTDRVEDLELRLIYKQMIEILKKNFQGVSNSQEDYVRKVQEITDLGRNSVLHNINDLVKFGIINQYRGGYNRVNKIISLN